VFSCPLRLVLPNYAATIYIEEFVYEDDYYVGCVTSTRTTLSVYLGIVAAVSWHSISDGDLSGTGLRGRRLINIEPIELLTSLASGSEVSVSAVVRVMAERLGCGSFPFDNESKGGTEN